MHPRAADGREGRAWEQEGAVGGERGGARGRERPWVASEGQGAREVREARWVGGRRDERERKRRGSGRLETSEEGEQRA